LAVTSVRVTGELRVGELDVAACLEATLPTAGGTVTGGLEIAGTLRVRGGCLVGAPPPISGTGGQQEDVQSPDLENQDIEALRDSLGNHGTRAVGVLRDLSMEEVSLQLLDPSLLLVQILGSFVGKITVFSGMNRGSSDLPRDGQVALWVEQGGRRGIVAGMGASGAAIDVATLLGQPPPRAVIRGEPVSSSLNWYDSYEHPIAQTWLLLAPPGELRLGLAACGYGVFRGMSLQVTTLPEVTDV
ncbi:MAG TPA: hypothetical protein PLA94_21430, partial [Myxococcota bacterium]|nr:hypothetical protein [Myxococcota bacterium]